MAANKRTKIQIVADRELVSRLYLQGKTQQEIADTIRELRGYALDRSMISKDLKAVQEEWILRSVQSVNVRKARELALLDELERQAWAAWEKSKEMKRGRKASTKNSGTESGTTTVGESWEEDQVGDPRYLQVMLDIVEKRMTILGIKAPTKVRVDGDAYSRIPWDLLTKEQVSRIANGEPVEKVIPNILNN